MSMNIELSRTERAILANQHRILAALGDKNNVKDDELPPEQHRSFARILEGGFESEYSQVFQKVRNETISADVRRDVFAILDMFRAIHFSLQEIPDPQKDHLDLKKLSFQGFDNPRDDQALYLDWWIEAHPDSYYHKELGDLYQLNSHSSLSLDSYKDMLDVYSQFNTTKPMRHLTLEELQAIQEVA